MSFPGRVFVASGDIKSGRMSFVQAQRDCFEEDSQGAEEERLARQLKEENNSRVDAILEAELKRRQENQHQAEEPPGRFEDQRLKALQRLHSMEWKRNQQDHVKIAREQAVRYEEVKSRRAAEEVFFEGTRQGKTKTRKFRKDEVIHSFNEITPKLPQMQPRKVAPALPSKVPQPCPPPSNAWQHKRGSELFGSASVPSSAEEEETALRKALAASMESFYAEQKNAELAITRSVSIGRKCSEEKRDTTFCKSEMQWLAAEYETDTFARKSEILPNREEYCKMPQNNFLLNGLSENTNILPTTVRNSGVYCEPVSAAGKQVRREELELRGGSPQNCQLVSRSPECEELESSEESEKEWEGDKDNEVSQESNMPSYCPKFQNVTRTPEPTFSEPVASQTIGQETSQKKMFHHFPHVPEKNHNGQMCSRVRKDGDGQLESTPGRANFKHLIASSVAELPLTSINSESDTNLTHTVYTSSAPLSCSRTCSLSSDLDDEKPKDNSCKKTEESPVDPSCFLKFEKIPNAKSVDSETTSMATAVPSSSVDCLFVSDVPTPQPPAEPHQPPVFYQDQNISAMSELGDMLSALKLQTQGYPATSIPRQPQPYNLVPGTIPGFTPDMCMALLGMYGPMWQHALSLGMFPAGPMMMDPRVQAAQLGLYSGNPLEAGAGGPIRAPMMQEAVAPDIPRAALPQQFLQPGMFMHPSMYPGPRPGAHTHAFQDAAQQSAMPHLASLRPPLVNPIPFLDPQLANLSRSTDQGLSQSMPAKSSVHQDQPPAFLYAASGGGKGAYPSMEPMMPPPGVVYSHPQGFMNQPVGEQLPFPFGLPQVSPPLNPTPVPFQPKPEPDVGRGRGRLRH